jgi:hypothetical protein
MNMNIKAFVCVYRHTYSVLWQAGRTSEACSRGHSKQQSSINCRPVSHHYSFKWAVILIKLNAGVTSWHNCHCTTLSPNVSVSVVVLLHRRLFEMYNTFTNADYTVMHFFALILQGKWQHHCNTIPVMTARSYTSTLKHTSESTQNFEGDWVLPISEGRVWVTMAWRRYSENSAIKPFHEDWYCTDTNRENFSWQWFIYLYQPQSKTFF